MKEFDRVILQVNLPEYGLLAGDIGTIVMVHNGGAGYEVEFMTLSGETVAVSTLLKEQIRPIKQKEIAHVRQMAELG